MLLAALPAADCVAQDGAVVQADLGPGSANLVASRTRGRLSYGAVYSEFDDGHILNLALSFARPVRLGPADATLTLVRCCNTTRRTSCAGARA